jgi:hypothetical protein
MESESNDPNPTVYTPELFDLLQRGMAGDNSVLPQIKQAFDAAPQLSQMFGNLVSHAEQEIIGLAIGKDLVTREAITRQAAAERSRLQASYTSPLEHVLVERAVVCWLAVYEAELDLAKKRKSAPPSLPLIDAAVKRLDRAHVRHLSALRTLATVQKLLKPAPSVLELLGTPPAGKRARNANAAGRRSAANPVDGSPVAN